VRSLATCGEHDKLVPYLRVQYCAFGGGVRLTNAFRVAVAFACVAVLSTCSRRFFLPALESLARACRLPDDAAGATLLALANAAPWLVAKALRVAERCARGGCVGGFADDPRRGEGLRADVGEALRGAAILVALVFPVCVLATPHGMGGRARRNEDDEHEGGGETNEREREATERDEEARGIAPRTEYTPVLTSEEDVTQEETQDETRENESERRMSSPKRTSSETVPTGPDELRAPLLRDPDRRDDVDDRSRFRYAVAPGRELARLTGASRSRTLRAFWKRHVEAVFEKGGVELERAPFARDAIFFLAAALVSVSLAGNGALSLIKTWTLVGLYVAYVAAVALPGWIAACLSRHTTPHSSASRSDAARRENGEGPIPAGEPFDDAYAALVGDAASAGSLSLGLVTDLPGSSVEGPAEEPADGSRRLLGPRNGAPGMRWGGGGAGSASSARDARDDGERRRDADADALPLDARFGTLPFRRVARTCVRLCFVAIEAPFLFALRVTMPDLAADPARRSRLLASLLPMTAPAFLVTAERAFPNGGLDADAMVYGLAVGALGAVALWCAWPALASARPRADPEAHRKAVAVMDAALSVVAFVVSATWMHAAAGELAALTRAAAADALGDAYWEKPSATHSATPGVSGLVATFHALVSWCRYGGALFATAACARRGKPAVAAGACFSHAAFELLVGAAAPALAAYAFGDAEGSNPGLARDVFRNLFSNEVVVSTAFVVALAVYMAFAVPWAHEWRVGRGAACGFLAAYFVFSLFHGFVETGVLFREPWFGEGR